MYSPKIDEELIPLIYRRAKDENKPMTRFVSEVLYKELYKTFYCQSCNNQIIAEAGSKEGYCEKCDSVVFLITATR